jgi:hypothetical protein
MFNLKKNAVMLSEAKDLNGNTISTPAASRSFLYLNRKTANL